MRQTFAKEMLNVGQIDDRLVVLVGDISHFALQAFAKACPGRFYNVGICEPTIISIASGLSHAGFYPVVHTIAPFLIERGFEQIKLDFCYQELGGNLISVGSAFDYSGLGVSHYCYNDVALIKSLPGTQIVCPAMPNEFTTIFGMTYHNSNLTYFRLPEVKHGFNISDDKIELGKAIKLRDGEDITIIAFGPQLKTVVQCETMLRNLGIDFELIYIHTIKPFDVKTISDSAQKTGKVLAIEEHSMYGGGCDEVMRVVGNLMGVNAKYISIPNYFVHGYGKIEDHYEYLGFTSQNVLNYCKQLLGLK
ncbi:MAG: hypothetical protein HQ510_06465 [Candidatus Marinimicrobia bacterium]|nr:hypothetical protein [Candidatus Neomarinimicrobiota bacterium]